MRYTVEVQIGGVVEVDALNEDEAVDLAIDYVLKNGTWDTFVEAVEDLPNGD